MNSADPKAVAFVERLLKNPFLSGFSLLQREEQLIQFLRANAAQLAPTLSSAAFFPGKNWMQIMSLLVGALAQITTQQMQQEMELLLSNQVNLGFLSLVSEQQVNVEQARKQLLALAQEYLAKAELRRAFVGPYAAVRFRLASRYVNEVFERKTYIHFELTKVQRLRLGAEEAGAFVDVAMWLRPAIALVGATPADSNVGMVQSSFAGKAATSLAARVRAIPEPVIKSAVNTSVSFFDNHLIEATSRLAAVLSARARTFQAGQKVDRGADTPDKSWLSVARRNYKHYGFDIKLLDELYQIAAERRW